LNNGMHSKAVGECKLLSKIKSYFANHDLQVGVWSFFSNPLYINEEYSFLCNVSEEAVRLSHAMHVLRLSEQK